VSGNSLLSTGWIDKLVNDMVFDEVRRMEAVLQEYLDKGYQRSELKLRRHWDGGFTVHVITPEEVWLDWHSANHGWST
jgi:hypothetical protein